MKTIYYGRLYHIITDFKLKGFPNEYFAGDKNYRKSTNETCQFLKKALISWNSKK